MRIRILNRPDIEKIITNFFPKKIRNSKIIIYVRQKCNFANFYVIFPWFCSDFFLSGSERPLYGSDRIRIQTFTLRISGPNLTLTPLYRIMHWWRMSIIMIQNKNKHKYVSTSRKFKYFLQLPSIGSTLGNVFNHNFLAKFYHRFYISRIFSIKLGN